MREPTFGRDGYPTDETLDAITKWDVSDLTGLFRFLTAAWSEYGQCTDQLSDSEREVAGVEGEHQIVRLVTGGWSGNESLLAALEQNGPAYWMTWRLSARGGLHIFEVRGWPDARPPRTLDKKRRDKVSEEEVVTTDLATLIRDYQAKSEEVGQLKDSIKPASQALKEANAALRSALRDAGAPVVLDGRMYRLLGNGQLAVEEIKVLGAVA